METKQGQLLNIRKAILTVDETYQRSASRALVRKIQQNWSWPAAASITVSLRDGVYHVVDGQHRVLAAMNKPEITHLPCIVFENLTVIDEARQFAMLNKVRRNITSVELFHADVAGADELAMYVNNRLHAFKFRVDTKGANTAACVKPMLKLAAKSKPSFDRVLSACARLFKNGKIIGQVFEGLAYIDSKDPLDPRLVERLLDVGVDKIRTGITQQTIASANRHVRTLARGIVDTANKNLRHKFDIEL